MTPPPPSPAPPRPSGAFAGGSPRRGHALRGCLRPRTKSRICTGKNQTWPQQPRDRLFGARAKSRAGGARPGRLPKVPSRSEQLEPMTLEFETFFFSPKGTPEFKPLGLPMAFAVRPCFRKWRAWMDGCRPPGPRRPFCPP